MTNQTNYDDDPPRSRVHRRQPVVTWNAPIAELTAELVKLREQLTTARAEAESETRWADTYFGLWEGASARVYAAEAERDAEIAAHKESVPQFYELSAEMSALEAEAERLRALMQEAVDNCPTCMGEKNGCARCATFNDALQERLLVSDERAAVDLATLAAATAQVDELRAALEAAKKTIVGVHAWMTGKRTTHTALSVVNALTNETFVIDAALSQPPTVAAPDGGEYAVSEFRAWVGGWFICNAWGNVSIEQWEALRNKLDAEESETK